VQLPDFVFDGRALLHMLCACQSRASAGNIQFDHMTFTIKGPLLFLVGKSPPARPGLALESFM
jgi:hypothetical protein